MDQTAKEAWERHLVKEIEQRVNTCMQCGTCSGSCGSSYAMDYTPRRLWRMVQLRLMDEIFKSKTFALCSSCYYCTLRCPRGLRLTENIQALKQLAALRGLAEPRGYRFYKTFLDTVRRYGRVREMELMTRYFLAMKNPVLPFGFTPLGLRLMAKGKVAFEVPKFFGPGKLDALYKKVEELEAV